MVFGSTFVPMLQRVVGWLSTAASAAQRFAANFKYIFGGDVKTNAVSVAGASAKTADSIGEIKDAYEGASGASKKFQRQMMGIDTLNRLSSASSGGGGGGALEEAEQDIADYEEALAGMVGTAEVEMPTHSKFVQQMKADWEHFLDLFRDPKKWFSDEWSRIKQNLKFEGIFDGGILKTYDPAVFKQKVKKFFWDDGIKLAWEDTKVLFETSWATWVENWNSTKEWAVEVGVKIRDKAVDLWQKLKTDWQTVKDKTAEFAVKVKTRAGEIWNQVRSWFQGRSLGLSVYYDAPNNGFQQAVVSALGLAGWPHLSFAAKGGIVDQATLFGSTVVGEAGKEAIIPLERNTGWMDGVANRIEQGLGSDMVAALNSGNNEQNSLLREQNRLLRALLEKEAVIRPSAAMGQVIKKSADMYARTSG